MGILLIILGVFLLYLIIEYFLFINTSYQVATDAEDVVLHFIHGSIKRGSPEQPKRVGGPVGGHVEVEIDGLVFGFEYDDINRIHYYSRKKQEGYNSKFTLKTLEEWLEETRFDKITSIRIPIPPALKGQMANQYRVYKEELPYDYAFLGVRCASSAYELFAEAGVLPKKSRAHYILHAFYPRLFRKRMLKWAQHNQLQIVYKAGVAGGIWE